MPMYEIVVTRVIECREIHEIPHVFTQDGSVDEEKTIELIRQELDLIEEDMCDDTMPDGWITTEIYVEKAEPIL